MSYTIGIDVGTQSVRVVLVDTRSGRIMVHTEQEYIFRSTCLDPHTGNLFYDPDDFLTALISAVKQLLLLSNIQKDEIIGLAIDAVSFCLIPTDRDLMPLCHKPEFSKNPYAYMNFWRNLSASCQAEVIQALAVERKESFLGSCGNQITGDLMLPKLTELLIHAPEVDESAEFYLDLCDWLTAMLTGKLCRNESALLFKAFWTKEHGFPPESFLRLLHPKLPSVLHKKWSGSVMHPGEKAGGLTGEMAKTLALNTGIAVSVGTIDGHAPLPAVAAVKLGDMLISIGTSSVMLFVGDSHHEINGIVGGFKDGLYPGIYGYVAGQYSVGDLFAWFLRSCVSEEYVAEAQKQHLSLHQLLSKKAEKLPAGAGGLIALDWWNGNRSILGNANLSGLIVGFTLNTKPEEIYRCLSEAVVFGAKRILTQYEQAGGSVRRIIACGGIARRSPFQMQLYADIFHQDILVSRAEQPAALGSAICAASAAGAWAGGFDSLSEAVGAMASNDFLVYKPDLSKAASYDRLYSIYCRLHDFFGREEPYIMKELRGE